MDNTQSELVHPSFVCPYSIGLRLGWIYELLGDYFVGSGCPLCAIPLDPICGSATFGAVASTTRCLFIGIDIHKAQVDLARGARSVSHKSRLSNLPPAQSPCCFTQVGPNVAATHPPPPLAASEKKNLAD